MPRARQRATLESGLKLDINRLCRKGFIRPGSYAESSIRWTDSNAGELRACRIIRAEMRDPYGWNWFCIQIDDDDSQLIALEACERHFGGWQWYFVCPRTGLKASVLWMPPGARSFASRKRWERQVAYHSQFLSEIDRAHRGKDRINRRLCSVGSFDPSEWEFQPKPKWMRWPTYHRAEEKFDRYEATLDEGTFALVAKFLGAG